MTAPRKRGPGRPRGPTGGQLTDASVERVFDALQSLAVKHGSMAAAARVVGCSRETVRLILAKGHGVAPDLAQRILDAAGEAPAVERRPTALERLRAGRETRRPYRRDVLRAERVKQLRIERADYERRVATVGRRAVERAAMGRPAEPTSALDTLAALVATLLVRHTVDPVGEIDPGRDGFARRVERHALALLLDEHDTPGAVALATRGRPVGATLQRNFKRHEGNLGSLSPELEHTVRLLLRGAPGAWRDLRDALDVRPTEKAAAE